MRRTNLLNLFCRSKYPHCPKYIHNTMSSIQIHKKAKHSSSFNAVKKPKNIDFGVNKDEDSLGPRKTREELKPIRESLPIYAYRNGLMEALRKHKNLIVVGETGSGKTTQIPQYLLEDGFAKKGIIGCTQPRRVAAINVADRVSQEVGCELGSTVGYCIRFDDKTSSDTRLKYLTDGMLLREIQIDPRLSRYSVILLDEAHERTLNTDILFGLLKRLQETERPDLRVVAMSATLDAHKFSTYFNAPVAIIPGRTHKVDVFYLPEAATDVCEAAVVTALQLHQEKPTDGDILIFMAGADEIEDVIEAIKERAKLLPVEFPQLICHALYSTLSQETQMQAFQPTPPGCRKIVVSTNIAETSITLSGVKYVIDSGLAKVKTFNPSTGLELLQPQPISQAEAFQRSGRSGREREGECYRLYTEDAFGTLAASVEPEILRCSLTSAVLQIKSAGVKDVLAFDFIDPPRREAISRAEKELKLLNAVDEEGAITSLGRLMNSFPIEPRYARILIASAQPETAFPDFVKEVNKKSETEDPFLDIDFSNLNKHQRKQLQKERRAQEEAARAAKLQQLAEARLARDASEQKTLPFRPCSREMCTLIAALSTENLLAAVPKGNKQLTAKCDLARRKFVSPAGDMLMFLQLMEAFARVPRHEQRKWAIDHFVNLRNMRAALDARRQLEDILMQNGLQLVSCVEEKRRRDQARQGVTTIGDSSEGGVETNFEDDSYDDVKKCLLTGLFDRVAFRQYDGKYMSCGEKVFIHPTSIVSDYIRQADAARNKPVEGVNGAKNTHASAQSRTLTLNKQLLGDFEKKEHPYKVLIYHSIVHTTRTYVRDLMAVKEDWLYEVQPAYFEDRIREREKVADRAADRSDSHSNTLFKGQRTAFSNLTSNKLSATVDTGVGRANLNQQSVGRANLNQQSDAQKKILVSTAKSVVKSAHPEASGFVPKVSVNTAPTPQKKSFVTGFQHAKKHVKK